MGEKQMTPAIKAIKHLDLEAFTNYYKGKDDIIANYTDESGYHSIISMICQLDRYKQFKEILIKILNDAITNNITIESPNDDGMFHEGVCHWACNCLDTDVAKLMFDTPNVIINRVDQSFRTGAVVIDW